MTQPAVVRAGHRSGLLLDQGDPSVQERRHLVLLAGPGLQSDQQSPGDVAARLAREFRSPRDPELALHVPVVGEMVARSGAHRAPTPRSFGPWPHAAETLSTVVADLAGP